jgi:hypothetical protein
MPTLLPLAAHNALISNWAWHAYREDEESFPDDPQSGADTAWQADYTTAMKNIFTTIRNEATRLEGVAPEAPSTYADSLLSHLDGTVGPILDDQKKVILKGFRIYLDLLSANNSDPLREICDAVLAATVCMYRNHDVKVPKHVITSLQVHADHASRNLEASFPSPFKGRARVVRGCLAGNCCRETNDHFQTLHVTLIPSEFDRDALSALPFVLFHECVSHVMQGPWTDARKQPDRASQFAEGWMDLATMKVLEHALNDRRWSCRQHDLVPYHHTKEFFRSGGERMSEARRYSPEPNGNTAAESRRYGYNLAVYTLEAMRKARITDHVSAFLRLSFLLNTSELTPTARDTIASRLGGALRPPTKSDEDRRVARSDRLRRTANLRSWRGS